MDGKLGKLAKELTEEFTGDLKEVFDDTQNSSMKDIMAQMMKDPKKIMGIMKKITDKLQNKMQSGDISQEELMKEVSTLVEKFKEMGGGEDFMKNFTNGPFAKMFKNMAGGGASANQMVQLGKQSAMKERLRKKMEEKKVRELALQTPVLTQAQTQTQVPALTPALTKPNTFVVKIGEEKQEKSTLNEEELIKMFNDKKKKKGKK